MSSYHLPEGYRSQSPAHYVPFESDVVWQPDVYAYAAEIARQRECRRLLDLGCSTAEKLLPFADEFELIGVDLDGQLPSDERAMWVAADLNHYVQLDPRLLRLSLIICSDVIEHLRTPERLLDTLRWSIRYGRGCVLSTPDRERTRGADDLGPPANPCHAREWTASELVAWLTAEGFVVTEQTWQRSHSQSSDEATTVLLLDVR